MFDTLAAFDRFYVLDLFAGTGILGFEALSRGAASVTFVEKSGQAIEMLKKNSLIYDHDSINIVHQDCFIYLKNCPEFDLIFADPPYEFGELQLLVDLSLSKLKIGGRLALETSVRDGPNSGDQIKRYGDTQITIYKK